MKTKKGQLITLEFESREFEVIVIDPNGLGRDRPTVGFGFRMMEKHGGLSHQTASDWVTLESVFEGGRNNEVKLLKLPSGNGLRVAEILGLDGNEYQVLEVSDWIEAAVDIIKHPGKLRKPTRDKLIDFLKWFAVKGFYADAYTKLKGSYTEADSRILSAWMQARLDGKTRRSRYTKFLQEQGCNESYDYAKWTDYVYLGLFGMNKREMCNAWELVEGDSEALLQAVRTIGRNYIPEPKGLEAVAYCENMVIELFLEDLKQAHDDAIAFAKRKFQLSIA